jgi:hypothetical protein
VEELVTVPWVLLSGSGLMPSSTAVGRAAVGLGLDALFYCRRQSRIRCMGGVLMALQLSQLLASTALYRNLA